MSQAAPPNVSTTQVLDEVIPSPVASREDTRNDGKLTRALNELDSAASWVWRLAPLVGLLAGLSNTFELGVLPDGTPGGRLRLVIVVSATIARYGLAGVVVAALMKLVGAWALSDIDLRARGNVSLGGLLRRGAELMEHLATGPPARSESPADLVDHSRHKLLGEFHGAVKSRAWPEAESMLLAFTDDYPDDPRLAALRDELNNAQRLASEEHLGQIEAARQVNDPGRVLELHRAVSPLLDGDARKQLDIDLARWFLSAIHRRLRAGKVQAEVVLLAGEIAESFQHTTDGASLHAALPTLRRSAGLCPRCTEPYTGISEACPACLNGRQEG